MDEITPSQCRAARALLDWTQGELSRRSRVAVTTVRLFEKDRHETLSATIQAIAAALSAGGVKFLEGTDELEPSVALRRMKGRKRTGKPAEASLQ